MPILGYIASIFIGIILGMIGGGGSILTVPILIYLFNLSTSVATHYSLFIVGVTSFVGAVSYLKNKLVHFNTALIFGIPSICTVVITRIFILPNIPEIIFHFGSGFILTKNIFLLIIFAILMIGASYKMLKQNTAISTKSEFKKHSYPITIIQGLIVGMLTGLVGAGGGFLIIPGLMVLGNLNIKEAIGTSLIIIFVNSSIGFSINSAHINVNWIFLFSITLLSVIGIFIGLFFSKKINTKTLKIIFGCFVLLMGMFIIVKELFFT